jgi:hypothetical protein
LYLLWQRSVWIYWLSRHLRYDIDALSRAVDLARKTPDAIPLIGNNRFHFGVVPPDHIRETGFCAGSAAGTFIQIYFDFGTHAPSELYKYTLKR